MESIGDCKQGYNNDNYRGRSSLKGRGIKTLGTIADRVRHYCRQSEALLPTEGGTIADRGRHYCRQREALNVTDKINNNYSIWFTM